MNEEKMEKTRRELLDHFFEISENSDLDMREYAYTTTQVAIEMLATVRVLVGESFGKKYDDDLFVVMRQRYDQLVNNIIEYGKAKEH